MTDHSNIIIIGPGYPYRNGQSIYLAALCNRLSSEFKVELINYTMLYPNFLFPGTTQYDESKNRKISFPNKRLLSSLNPLSWIKTAKYINAQNPDLVVFDWWHPFFGPCTRGVIFFLSKKLKKKIVVITENVISHEANKADKILTRIGLNKVTCFLALSEAVEHKLNSMFRKKIFRSVLPIYDFYKSENKETQPGSSGERFGFQKEDIVFLFFGLIRKYKGLDLLIEAFALLKASYPSVKLLITGEFYEPVSPYLELIKKWNLEKDVYLENRYIPDEEVAPYFNACDCVVLPYRSATQSGILSMAYGFRKPVVVTNVGELAALVNPSITGFIAKEATVGSIKRSLEDFLIQKTKGADFKYAIESWLTEIDEFNKVNKVFLEILDYV